MNVEYKKHSLVLPNVYKISTSAGRYMGLTMCATKQDFNKMLAKYKDKSYQIEDWTIPTLSELLSLLNMLQKPDLFNNYHIQMLNLINLRVKKQQFKDFSIDDIDFTDADYTRLKKVFEEHGYKLTKTRPTKEKRWLDAIRIYWCI